MTMLYRCSICYRATSKPYFPKDSIHVLCRHCAPGMNAWWIMLLGVVLGLGIVGLWVLVGR